ncbi:TPA: DUF357 domain-containing protein [Candidatus Woesearchaeota archaeon]|nr:DUF357 domain-containing protein [Candidatus Woesearchaeota archaeon]HIJ18205.1 DUF357 domain-containing protein [Candidatus Woesearchaeota archaeon]
MEEDLKERLEKYLSLTKEALGKIKATKKDKASAADLLDLSRRYYEDALHFRKKGDLIRAYGAVCYAHCFLDAGVRAGLLDGSNDSRLFMVDGK